MGLPVPLSRKTSTRIFAAGLSLLSRILPSIRPGALISKSAQPHPPLSPGAFLQMASPTPLPGTSLAWSRLKASKITLAYYRGPLSCPHCGGAELRNVPFDSVAFVSNDPERAIQGLVRARSDSR